MATDTPCPPTLVAVTRKEIRLQVSLLSKKSSELARACASIGDQDVREELETLAAFADGIADSMGS